MWPRRFAFALALAWPGIAIAGPPTDASAAPASASRTPATCPVSAIVGEASAPVVLELFIDLSSDRGEALSTFLDLRRLVADLGPELAMRVHFFLPEHGSSVAARRTIVFGAALMAEAGPLATLRAFDRSGWSKIDATLLHDSTPELPGIDAATLSRARAKQACAQTALEAHGQRLRARFDRWENNASVFVGVPTGTGIRLENRDKVRNGEVLKLVHERLRTLRRPMTPPALPEVPPPTGPSFSRTAQDVEPQQPAPLGGLGLEHELVLFADSEDDHTLTTLLPPALGIRRLQPGVLAIRVVARGEQGPARRLRSRLCAARTIGRELDYYRYLARSLNERAGPREETLLSRLDTAAHQGGCSDEPQSTRGVPRGAALDGRLGVNRSDLETISGELATRERRPSAGISDWFWTSPSI